MKQLKKLLQQNLTLVFLFASALLLAGLALCLFEFTRAEGVRPFLLLGALVMVIGGGAWLVDEFVLRRHS